MVHAPHTDKARPADTASETTLRFAGMQAAASSRRLGWRSHEAAWSRRPSRWCQHASRVAAAQTALSRQGFCQRRGTVVGK
eukprot:scaffold98368_cov61-Phaeocystis_antarctica.AAC.3